MQGLTKPKAATEGYAYYHQGYGFVGDSHWAAVLDMRDLDNIQEIGRGFLPGDLDTVTPYGNIAVLSVDDEAEDGIASVVMPWRRTPIPKHQPTTYNSCRRRHKRGTDQSHWSRFR